MLKLKHLFKSTLILMLFAGVVVLCSSDEGEALFL